jgi:hypothetical protein
MKIWSRIGPDQGNEQDGPQPPERHRSANPKVRFLRPLTVSIREGGRFSGARPLLAQPPSRQTVPTAKKFREIPLFGSQTVQRDARSASRALSRDVQFCDVSNRFWRKNRSYRKQTTKPCLTGARTAIGDARFSRDFASLYPACPDEGKELSRRGMLSLNPLFESRTRQPDVQFSDKSNRSWRANRSYRKQTIKPSLTETRIARCDFGFLALFMRNLDVSNCERRPLGGTFLLHPRAANRGVTVRRLYGGRMLLLPGDSHEWVTSNAFRVI